MTTARHHARIAIALVMGTIAAFLIGCVNSDSDMDKSTLRIGNGAEPRSLDPHLANTISEGHIVTALFEGLVSQSADGDSEIAPGIATSWTIHNSHTRFVFALNPLAKWSNGSPIDAFAFVDSYERILNPELGAQNAELLYAIENAKEYHVGDLNDFSKVGVTALSAYELEIRLERPTPYFLRQLKHWAWFPVPIEYIRSKGPLHAPANSWATTEECVTNGPYTLESWRLNQRVSLRKSPFYWDARTTSIERIEFYPMENTQSEHRAFQAGQLDVTEEIPAEMKGMNLTGTRNDPLLATSYLLLNAESIALSDPRLRIALGQAIDRNLLIRAVVKSGFPATRFTPSAMPNYPIVDEPTSEPIELSDEEIARIDGFGPITMLVSNRDVSIALAEALQDIWRREVGIEIRIQNMEFKSYIERLDQGDYDISYIAWFGDYLDPSTFLDIWKSDSRYNRARWKNSQYDQLLAEAATQTNPAERIETLYKAESLLMKELPIIPLFWKSKDYLVSPRVGNWPSSLIDLRSYKHITLEN